MHSRRWLIAICLCTAIIAGGCWDGQELDRRATVLMLGIDKTDEGVRVGLQLARPQALAGSTGEGSGRDGAKVVTVVSRVGADVTGALHALQLAVDRDLFFGHTRVILVSEDVAREGILRHLQPLYGGAELLPRSAWLFVVKGSVDEVLAHRPDLDAIPANYLTHFFDNRILLQRPYEVTLGSFHRYWVTPGVEPIVVWIAPGQPDQSAPTLLGLAAFHGDRFVGGLGRVPSKGWVITQNQPPPGRLPIPCPGRPGTLAVRVVKSQNRIRPKVQNGSVKGVQVVANVQARIEGIGCSADMSDLHEFAKFEQAFHDEITHLIREGIRRAQTELQTDVFGFGKAIYRFAHWAWPGDERWAELFPDLPVQVNVTVQLEYTGSYLVPQR